MKLNFKLIFGFGILIFTIILSIALYFVFSKDNFEESKLNKIDDKDIDINKSSKINKINKVIDNINEDNQNKNKNEKNEINKVIKKINQNENQKENQKEIQKDLNKIESNKYDFEEDINFYTNFQNYRFGDIFFGRLKEEKEQIEKEIVTNYPTSLASQYIKSRIKNEDFDLLIKLINDYSLQLNKEWNLNNMAVVHLRLGDVCDDPIYKNTIEKIKRKLYENIPVDDQEWPEIMENIVNGKKTYEYVNINFYLKSISYFKRAISILKQNGINEILLMAGSHIKCKNYKLSTFYFNEVKKLFINNDFIVYQSIGKHPDNDVYLVSKCRYFVVSKGGYSSLLKQIAKNNETIIIE